MSNCSMEERWHAKSQSAVQGCRAQMIRSNAGTHRAVLRPSQACKLCCKRQPVPHLLRGQGVVRERVGCTQPVRRCQACRAV